MRDKDKTNLVRWFDEVWTKGNESVIDEMLDRDILSHGIGENGEMRGIDAFKVFYKNFRNQLSDIRIEVDDVISEDGIESARCSVTARDANGRPVHFNGLCMARFDNGKIVEAWNHFDFLSMYQQMGYQLSAQVPSS